jgi:hypothetical protein
MSDWLVQFGGNLFGRITGLLVLRLLLQLITAVVFAIRDGVKDAREGRPGYVWTILTNASLRRGLLMDGWIPIYRVVAVGVVTDAVFQFVAYNGIHPIGLIPVVLSLTLLPYLGLRGPVDRMARRVFQAAPRRAHAGR